MRIVSLVLIAVFLLILILMIRILQYHPVWNTIQKKKKSADPEAEEKVYWQTRESIFLQRNPLNRMYYDTQAFSHGMLVRYKGTNEQKGNILFTVYDETIFNAIMLACERILRHNEAPLYTFTVLYSNHPSAAFSQEALAYLKKNYMHFELCLSLLVQKSASLALYRYLLLGVQRQKTMQLESGKLLHRNVSAVYDAGLTLPALKIMQEGNDHRLVLRYRMARKKALDELEKSGLAYALCDTCTMSGSHIELCASDDEGVEKMLSRCQDEAEAEGTSLYVTSECEAGKHERESIWQKKITACYEHCDLVEVVPAYFRDDEEAELERVCHEHLSFMPEDFRQLSIIDFFVSLLSQG